MYDHPCLKCGGNVREVVSSRQAVKQESGFVFLDNVAVGVCERCGSRYFDDAVLRRASEASRAATAHLSPVESSA
jgi:YgiT-type zinc finger domain-containing protein